MKQIKQTTSDLKLRLKMYLWSKGYAHLSDKSLMELREMYYEETGE